MKVVGLFLWGIACLLGIQAQAQTQGETFPIKYENVWYDIQSLFQKTSTGVRHPGGPTVLVPHKGKDITAILNGFHQFHRGYLAKCPRLENYEEEGEAAIQSSGRELVLAGELEFFMDNESPGGKLGLIKTSGISLDEAKTIHRNFREWVLAKDKMPCIAAKTVLCGGTYGFFISHAPLGSKEAAIHHLQALAYLKIRQTQTWKKDEHFTSILGIFPMTVAKDNKEYEEKIFQHQQWMLDMDPGQIDHPKIRAGQSVSGQDPEFGFSVHNRPYFVVGLSPVADRVARRAPYFGMAFNAREQFEWLDRTSQFDNFSKAIQKRDIKISGNINPNIKPGNINQTEGWETSGVDHSKDPDFVVPLVARPLKERLKTGEVLKIKTYK